MITALALAAALAASPGSFGSPGSRTCYNLGRGVDSHYYPVNDHTILVSVGIHAYRITTVPNAGLGDPSTGIQVRGSGIVCSPLDIQLSAIGPSVGRSSLIIRNITPLPREQAEELRRGQPRRSVLRR